MITSFICIQYVHCIRFSFAGLNPSQQFKIQTQISDDRIKMNMVTLPHLLCVTTQHPTSARRSKRGSSCFLCRTRGINSVYSTYSAPSGRAVHMTPPGTPPSAPWFPAWNKHTHTHQKNPTHYIPMTWSIVSDLWPRHTHRTWCPTCVFQVQRLRAAERVLLTLRFVGWFAGESSHPRECASPGWELERNPEKIKSTIIKERWEERLLSHIYHLWSWILCRSRSFQRLFRIVKRC